LTGGVVETEQQQSGEQNGKMVVSERRLVPRAHGEHGNMGKLLLNTVSGRYQDKRL